MSFFADLFGGSKPQTGSMSTADLMRQSQQNAFINSLGRMGANLLAAGQGGITPAARANLLGQAFGQFQTPDPFQQAMGLAQLEQAQGNVALQKQQMGLAQQRQNILQGIMGGSTTGQTQTGPQAIAQSVAAGNRPGPTPEAAAHLTGGTGADLLGSGPGLMGQLSPTQKALFALDPEAGAGKLLTESFKVPETVNYYDPKSHQMQTVVKGSDQATSLRSKGWVKGTPPAPPTGMTRQPDGTLSYDPNYLSGQSRLRQAGRSSTVVNNNVGPQGVDYGDPPKDHYWARKPDGEIMLEKDPVTNHFGPVAVPVKGGPAYVERAETAEAKKEQKKARGRTADTIMDQISGIGRVMESATIPTTGLAGFLTSQFPGSAGFDVKSKLDVIKANVGFDKLQAMRDASPTGGALGQVSERENTLLQSSIASLDQAQSEPEFRTALEAVQQAYLNAKYGTEAQPTMIEDRIFYKLDGKWYEDK